MSSRLSLIVLTILLHVLIAIDHTSLASETQSDPALISAAFNLKKLKPTVFYSSKGLLVLKVTPGSREEAAGIQRGDVIVRLDGKAVQKVEEVTSAGDENRGYTIEYINGKELKVAQLPGKTDMGLLALDDEEVLKFLFSRIIDPFKSPSSSTTNLRGTALADITLGLKKAETSDYAEALRNYDKAMAAIGNSDDPLLNGLIYKKLGELYEKERQPAKALVYYQKSLDNFKRYDSPQFLSRLYFRMAMMNAALGRPDEALNQGKSGIEILAATGFPSDAGDAHASLGDLHNALQNEDKALESYSKAIDCYRRSNERQKEGELRVRIGSIHSGRGDMRRATQEFSRAHSIFLGTGDPSALASVYLAMADTHHKADNNSLALRNLEKALQLTAETGDSATSADIQQLKTIVKVQILLDELIANPIMEATGANQKLTSLHLDIAATSKLMEKIRRHSGADDLKKGITIANNDYFEIAIDALLQLNALIRTKPKGNSVTAMEESKRAAFRLAESMKARYFLDQLAERHVELEKGIDPDLKRQRDELEKKLSQMQAKLQHQPADKDGDGEKSHNLRQYAQKEQEFEDLKGKIRLRNPLYAAVEYPEPVDVKAVQSILRPDEALLEYCLAGDSVYRFQVSRDSFNVVQLDIDRHDLEKEIGILKRSVSTFGTNRKLLVSPTRNRAKRLYDLLLGHVAEQYKDKTIIIVPDGAIATLPFELLRTDDGFAIEKHNFAYVQSASVLEVLRTHYKANGTAGFIGFGDPVYDYGSFRDGKPQSRLSPQWRDTRPVAREWGGGCSHSGNVCWQGREIGKEATP